ncbi:hypothetical protein RAD15_06835 [Bradyrhizobium sp. 14AA]
MTSFGGRDEVAPPEIWTMRIEIPGSHQSAGADQDIKTELG